MLILSLVSNLYNSVFSHNSQDVEASRHDIAAKRDEFLNTFIKTRNSQMLNVDIFKVGNQCNMDNFSSAKMALELEEEGLLKSQDSGSRYSLTLKGRKKFYKSSKASSEKSSWFSMAQEGKSPMSSLQPRAMASQAARRVVASFQGYGETQKAVACLPNEKSPVEYVAIVGEGLRLVAQAKGHPTWWKATVMGLVNGAITGLLFGWLLGLFVAVDPFISVIGLAIWGVCFGAFIGSIIGSIAYAATVG